MVNLGPFRVRHAVLCLILGIALYAALFVGTILQDPGLRHAFATIIVERAREVLLDPVEKIMNSLLHVSG